MDAERSRKKDRLVFWGTCAIYGLFFVFLFSSFSGHNILHFRLASKPFASTFYPIRWNLYTKTAGEKVLRLYQPDRAGNWEEIDMRPFTPRFLFGLNRSYKVIYQELAIVVQDTALLAKISPLGITMPKGEDLNKYVVTDSLKFKEVSPANVLYLRGKCLVSVETPVSWQQARHHGDSVRRMKLYPLNIVGK
jgi:hypothetical protein